MRPEARAEVETVHGDGLGRGAVPRRAARGRGGRPHGTTRVPLRVAPGGRDRRASRGSSPAPTVDSSKPRRPCAPWCWRSAYMRRTNSVHPEVERRARQNIEIGYQRLLGFEVKSEPGGFDWWGKPPANLFLTAYALLEFHAMAEVHPVDPALLARIQAWLLAHQQADGSWSPAGVKATWSADFARGRSQVLTAYVAWGLARAGAPSAKANAWLEAHADATQDPYAVALDRARPPDGRRREPRGPRPRGPARRAGVARRARGPAGGPRRHEHRRARRVGRDRDDGARDPGAARRRPARRASRPEPSTAWRLWRGADGRFGTTQSTILALEALLAAAGATAGGDGDVTDRRRPRRRPHRAGGCRSPSSRSTSTSARATRARSA